MKASMIPQILSKKKFQAAHKIVSVVFGISTVILIGCTVFLTSQLIQQEKIIAEKETALQSLTQAEIEIEVGESEKLDINNDGILDLRVKMYQDEHTSSYYYYLGELGTNDATSFTPILFNGLWQPTLGPEIRFIDEYLISITPGLESTQLDAHVYAQQKPNSIPQYFTIQWLYQPKDVAEFSEEILDEYVSWLKKSNQTQTKKGVRIRVSDAEARELILSGKVGGGFVHHSVPSTLNGYDGTTYELWSKTGGETIFDARDECGKTCQFMSIGIE